MSEQSNLQLVQQAYAAFGRADIDGILRTLSQNVDWFIPGPTDIVPFVGRRHGPQEVATFFEILSSEQTAERFEPLEFIASGDRIVVLGTQRWHVHSTGSTYEDDWVHVFTIENGSITKFTEYHDTAAEAAAYRR
ncbi:nuclear transport factor 2 family protein [Burkholderia sp. Ac-20345]|uniref:nuclear transport factor 2 family protein n=1 Tax=Burkholderia sp. Ac-20345 TaxID=2703891 RepID=UPI00197B385F|nr:nuclear transport factor 2 family protein [Burkholderia sp. Ac-20345]MBN3779755.1 nuclear transport factor 2 family protein [Burkholderia sp. Ac-20345]